MNGTGWTMPSKNFLSSLILHPSPASFILHYLIFLPPEVKNPFFTPRFKIQHISLLPTLLVSQLLNPLIFTSILIPTSWIFQNLSHSSLDFVFWGALCLFPFFSHFSRKQPSPGNPLGLVIPDLRFSNIFY